MAVPDTITLNQLLWEVARDIVLENGIQGHSVRAVEPIELPSKDLRLYRGRS